MNMLVIEDDAEAAAYILRGLHEHGHVACVDGPLGARGLLHDLTSGAMAVMCPACDAAR